MHAQYIGAVLGGPARAWGGSAAACCAPVCSRSCGAGEDACCARRGTVVGGRVSGVCGPPVAVARALSCACVSVYILAYLPLPAARCMLTPPINPIPAPTRGPHSHVPPRVEPRDKKTWLWLCTCRCYRYMLYLYLYRRKQVRVLLLCVCVCVYIKKNRPVPVPVQVIVGH